MEHQKSHRKISEHVPHTTETVCLCLNEKYEIAKYKEDDFLNKRTEIINTCRQRVSTNLPIVEL